MSTGKTLYIVRHAKSSWADMSMTDKQRPLNSRGEKAAPLMALHCRQMGYLPDAIISSTAVRAYSTAAVFKEVLGISDEYYKTYDSLYHAPAHTYFETCYELEDGLASVMLFGHNPGITYLANEVSEQYIDNVPTCGLLVIKSTAEQWVDVHPSNSRLMLMQVPKNLSDEL